MLKLIKFATPEHAKLAKFEHDSVHCVLIIGLYPCKIIYLVNQCKYNHRASRRSNARTRAHRDDIVCMFKGEKY